MKFKEIIVQANQSIYDLAVQEYGHADHIHQILKDNPALNLVDDLLSGTSVRIALNFETIDPRTQRYYRENKILVATATPLIDEDPYMPYEFIDDDAMAYYDALTTANGGDIDSISLYDIGLDVFKETIDQFVIDLKSAGVWTQLSRFYPFLGGTVTTHAINMINAVSELTYVNAPEHSNYGMKLNGTNYADMNNTPADDYDLNDAHLMCLFDNASGGQIGMGSSNTGANALRFLFNSNTSYNFSAHNSTTGNVNNAISPNYNERVVTGSRTSSFFSGLYINDMLENSIATSGGGMPTSSCFIGAMSNGGSAIYKMNGMIKAASIGYGLSAVEVSTLADKVKGLNILIGR